MAKVNEKLKSALASEFRGAKVQLGQQYSGKGLGGTLVWEGFEGKPQIDRQVELRRAIDKALGPGEQVQVSFILTVTPEEMASIAEND